MPTIIDSLFVEIGFQTKGVQVGQKQTSDALKKTRDDAERTAKEMELRGKQAAAFFGQIRNQVIGLFAAFTAGAGLKAFVTDVTTADAAAGRLAKNLGISATELTTWEGAARLAGGSAEGIAGSMQNLTNEFQTLALTGQSAVVPYFRAVNVALADTSGKMRPLGDILLDLSDKFSHMAPAQAQALGRGMGLDQDTITMLERGKVAVREYLEEARKSAPTAKDIAGAEARQKSFRDLTISSEKLGRIILTTVTPFILKLTEALTALSQWAQQHSKFVEAVFAGLAVAVGVLGAASAVALGTFLGLSAPVLAIAAAIGAAATAAALLYQNWDKLLDIIKHTPLYDEIVGAFAPALQWIEDKAQKVWDVIRGKGPDVTAEAGSGAGKTIKASGGTQSDIAAFVSMGWTRQQAAGIVASIQRESSGDANAVGDSGNAFGLAQWHRDRQADFAKWAGHDIRNSTRQEQLAFINYELREGKEKAAGTKLSAVNDARAAGDIVSRSYERPADVQGEATKRAQLAGSLFAGPAVDRGLSAANPGATSGGNTTNSTSSNQTNIGTINVNTKATDAAGIAKSIGPEIRKRSIAPQANTSLD
jgi:hypothetical protein